MSRILISGGRKLYGTVTVQGAKNAILPLLAATLLADGVSIIDNCPELSDVSVSADILTELGCTVIRNKNTISVDTANANRYSISDELMRKMRSSIVFLGAIASRNGIAVMSSPGGCELGPRPIDIHISSLKKLGMTFTEKNGRIICRAEHIHGADVTLPLPSVGATENLILAAVKASGITRIINAAREPEVSDLANFLNSCGARISGQGTGEITIIGVEKLTACRYRAIPDRIVAATYMCAVAAAGGAVRIKGAQEKHLSAVISCLREAGCRFEFSDGAITVSQSSRPSAIERTDTVYYPGFPTDAGSPLISVMCVANGTSVLVENIFENRFRVADELVRMGASVRTSGRVAVVNGVKALHGARVCASDLRAGAALVIAGLCAEGTTEISGVGYIDRGYEAIEKTFGELGADIKRVD